MKMLLAVLPLLILVSGCATTIPYSYKEVCAERGMVLTGINSGSSYGSATAWGGTNGPVTINSSGYTEAVSCGMPKTNAEKCEIERLQRVMAPKSEYNSNISTKRLITGAGYVLYVVPGIAAKIIYDGKRSNALEQSRSIANELNMCSLDDSQ